jgi:hypothetical protein
MRFDLGLIFFEIYIEKSRSNIQKMVISTVFAFLKMAL